MRRLRPFPIDAIFGRQRGLRRIFTRTQSRADFAQIPAFIKPQHDRTAVLFAQPRHGVVQQRRDSRPDTAA